MTVLLAVLSGFVLALFAPWLQRKLGSLTGWALAALPVALTGYFAAQLLSLPGVGPRVVSFPWVASLDVELSFYLDGLGLLFALLISGIGALVFIYAGGYLAGHPRLGRFYLYLLLFMASMLGLVLADNLLALFVFWELTSLSSYLLIGFEREREQARTAALQALLVTAFGGLALLVGFLLLNHAAGTLALSRLLEHGQGVSHHSLYFPILLLVLLGAFTKSAQFPFHFWLPNAMEAPTPVSAYLHSATMVKAGVYLLARLSPVLGDTAAWAFSLTTFGALTMLLGAWLALSQTDLKRILAYSTVSALGILILLLGVGTPLAAQAAILFLVAHALYKGALFLVAGALDHETGTRNVEELRGLRRAMPVTTTAAALAAFSMAGLPFFLGFQAKEFFLGAVAPSLPLAAPAAFTGVLLIAVAAIVGLGPFWGGHLPPPKSPHEAPVELTLGSALLAALGLLLGLFPGALAKPVVSGSVAAIRGVKSVDWIPPDALPGTVLLLSTVALAAGFALYLLRRPARRLAASLAPPFAWNPSGCYELALTGINALARIQTRLLQSGYLRYYLLSILGTAVALAAYTFFSRRAFFWPVGALDIRFYELAISVLILIACITAVRSQSRLAAIAALGVVGYGVALIYIFFGAPDLAMTQFLVETLTVILFVLVFYHLPRFAHLSSTPARLRDAVAALAVGAAVTLLVLATIAKPGLPPLSRYFAEHSLPQAHARNIVNVILVDFRALDTLGEITVLSVAGVGVYALLKLRLGKKQEP